MTSALRASFQARATIARAGAERHPSFLLVPFPKGGGEYAVQIGGGKPCAAGKILRAAAVGNSEGARGMGGFVVCGHRV